MFPALGVNNDSVFVTPAPTSTAFGYIQYTIDPPATSLMLVGKGAPLFNNTTSWGTAMQANMIHMMEHFAHTTEPTSPMDGQMWFDTNTYGPAMQVRYNGGWHGVVAEGLPVQGNINMNDFKIANVTNATTTYPYVASSTGWGNNDQEAVNLGTSDALYIAKTGGYDTVLSNRSGTMSGVLSVSPHIEGRESLTTAVGTTGTLRVGADAQAGISIRSNDSSFVYIDFVNASAQRTNVTYTFGTKLMEFGKFLDEATVPAACSINFSSGQVLTKKTTFTDDQEFITKLFTDSTYVNVTGDSMSGTLAMTGSANITLADGDIVLGTGNNTVSVLRNGTGASSIVFNTAGASTPTGNDVISLGNNMITGLSNAVNLTDAVSLQYADGRYVNVAGDTMTGALILNADPAVPLGAATKQYVDMLASGIIWLSPVQDNCLFNDTLSTPPADDGYTAYHKTFIVAGTGTGDWAGFDGHLMQYNGSTWESTLGRPVAIGDRFGVFMEPDNDDTLSSLPGGGLTGHAGKIATVTGISPYTYSFYIPAEPDALTVIGVPGAAAAQSFHMGHSYTFRGTYGVGTYETDYEWIEFLGPQILIDGAGLLYTGQTLNVDGNLLSLHNLSSNGIIVQTAANTIAARTITGTAGNIVVSDGDGVANNPTINLATVAQGSAGTSFVKVALDGYGRVTNNTAVVASDITNLVNGTYVNVTGDALTAGDLTLFQDPTNAMHAATKQYVDVSRVMALAGSVNGTTTSSAKILMAVTAQPFTVAATPSVTPSYGYVDVAPTAQTIFSIRKNGVEVGTMTFAAATNAATFTFASLVSFAAGDRITVVAPVTPDTTLADLYFTIRGTLV